MGLLKIISRSSNRTSKQSDHDGFEEEDDPLALANTPFINRPPPLDPRVEQDLRRACAVILADLKPSGYDIEDTRMKSDVLVDAQQREGLSYRQHVQPQAIQAQGPSQAQYAVSATATTTAGPAAAPADSRGWSSLRRRLGDDDQGRIESVRLSTNTQAQIASLMAPLESPLAPMPTNAQESRFESPRPAVLHKNKTSRLDSMGSSTSTQYTNGTDPSAGTGTSTGVTSAYGPSVAGSKRVSEMTTTQSPLSDARAGDWMKHGIQRHLASQEPTSAINAQSPISEGASKTSALRERPERPVTGHTWSISSVHSGRSESIYSESVSRAASSRQLSTDDGRAGVTPLKLDKDASIPPVPRMDPARKDRLEGDAAARAVQEKLAAATQKDKNDENLLRGKISGFKLESASASRPQTASKQPSHGILKYKHDDSIIVQDFWKPMDGRVPLKPVAHGSRTDPRPGDFDSLMPEHKEQQQQQEEQRYSQNHTSAPSTSSAWKPSHNASASASSSKSRSAPQIPSRTSSMTAQTQAPTGLRKPAESMRAASITSNTARSINYPASEGGITNGSALRTVTTQATADRGNSMQSPLSPVDIVYHSPSPDAAMGRKSHSGSMATGFSQFSASKERRGLGKLFHRLGGGDVPQRKKLYIPPHYMPNNTGLNYMQQGYPDDYWSDDDEVCAAPVVGFGRGW